MREIIQTRSQAQFLRLAALLVVIVLGLALRRFGYAVDLPFVVVKYGGSALWGAMVYLLVALIVARSRPAVLAIIALFIAISVELFRLYHTTLARRVSADHGRRAAAWPDILAVEYAGLCNRHRRGLGRRSRPSGGDCSSPVSRPSHEAETIARLRVRP
nr:DUF2809 domain-containing protein [Rhizobium hidalgonense]